MLSVPDAAAHGGTAADFAEFSAQGRPCGEAMEDVARAAGAAGAEALRLFWRAALLEWSDPALAPPFAHLVASVRGDTDDTRQQDQRESTRCPTVMCGCCRCPACTR